MDIASRNYKGLNKNILVTKKTFLPSINTDANTK